MLSVSELAQPFAMSLPAIMKHLDVLSDAGLIAREKTGRTVACRLTAKPMEQAIDWLNRYQRFWSENLDRLAAFVEEDPWPSNQMPPPPISRRGQASPSSAGSTRARRKSTPPGPIRKNSPVVRARRRQARFVRADVDPKSAGAFASASPPTRNIIEVGGVYREVVPNQLLVFSWAWHSTPERELQVTVSLKPDGDGTLLTVHHEQLFDNRRA